MRHRNALIPLLVLAVCIASCSKDSGGGSTGEIENARPAPLLEYRFEPGRESHYVHTTKIALKSPMFNSDQEMIFDVKVKPVKPEADGAFQLTCTYDRVRMKGNNPMAGGTAEYDSAAEDAAEQAKNPIVMPAVVIEGAEVVMTQRSDGKITSLSGMDAVAEKMSTRISETPGAGMVAGMLKGMYSDEAWQKTLEALTVVFPAETLEPGATWDEESKFPIPGLGEFGMSTTYTYQGSDDTGTTTVANLTYVSKLALEGFKPPEADPNNPMAGMMASLKFTSGLVTGTITFDMEAGRTLTHESNARMGMEMMGMQMQNEMKTTWMLAEQP